MVKTTYALTLFAAVSIAAPVQNAPTMDMARGEPMRRDGSGNLLGAGAGGAANDLVSQAFSSLEKQPANKAAEKTPQRTQGTQDAQNQNSNILGNLPVLGSVLGGGSKRSLEGNSKESQSAPQRTEGMQDSNNQNSNILDSLPLIGGVLGGGLKRSVESRSLTSDLSNFPVLGKLFSGNQNDNQNVNKPLGDGNAMPSNYDPSGKKVGKAAAESAMGENGQKARRDLNSDLTEKINALPIIGDLIGNKKKQASGKRDNTPSQYDPVYNLAEDITNKMEPTYNLADTASAAANARRDLNSDLTEKINALPIVGDLIGNKQKPAAKRAEKMEDSQYDPVYGLGEDLTQEMEPTYELADASSAAAGAVRRDLFDLLKTPQEVAKEKPAAAAAAAAQNPKTQLAQDDRKATDDTKPKNDQAKPAQDTKQGDQNPLAGLFKESGLGALMGNSHHGVGILPMKSRRDASIQARGDPIQGATLPDALLSGGVLGKVTKMLAPGGLQ
ncbi:hypothetical protein N7539_005866 [Penicillium diatomitis]|uniref:Uncharacterized protein n=1 Tax=Penicillium diatomitis TaxID=2819901 RepID=A0A9W9X5L0_9EURO|nr:uncharacterized protein N7539_005866 [Penicillium diatomitis]KAJ5484070.1 hypothetical protein N7539_005866 [Penicillium diatomitis]